MRPVAFVVGSLVEAWGEFRTHKARVLMSLIGVAVAVLALTVVAAISAVAQQSVTEASERSQGRPATLSFGSPYPTTGEYLPYTGDFDAVASQEMKRYGIRWWTRIGYGLPATIAGREGATSLNLQTVDPAWGTMHRVQLTQGSWFRDSDADRFAPALIVDTATWRSLGAPDLRSHPTVRLLAPSPATAVIVGVTPGGDPGYPNGMMLYDAYERLAIGTTPSDPYAGSATYEAWVSIPNADPLADRLKSDLTASAGDGWTVDVRRSDYLANDAPDPLFILKVVAGASAGFILLLGLLGLVNISMVTVRTRVREIGIRRSFGATAGRVFVGVMLESVVATTAAGVVGVILAILALKNPVVDGLLHQAGLQDIPAFPASAAVFGLVVAAGAGALAGLLPAIVAVRVKPIDAIRY